MLSSTNKSHFRKKNFEVFQSIQSFTHLRVIDKKSADLKVIEFDYCEKVIQLDYRGISEPA